MIRCPSGHWCPLGSFEPWECSTGTLCGEGASHRVDIAGLIVVLALDIILLGATLGVSSYKKGMGILKRRRKAGQETPRSEYSIQPATPESGDKGLAQAETADMNKVTNGVITEKDVFESPDIEAIKSVDNGKEQTAENFDETNEDLKKLVESFDKCIDGKHFGLAFDFHELGLTLKGGKQLLADVNGTIERGTMWGVMGPSGAGKSKNSSFVNISCWVILIYPLL